MFLADTIGDGQGPGFDAALDRTPFVRIVAMDGVLLELKYSGRGSESQSALRTYLIGLLMDGVMIDGDAEKSRS